MSSLWMGLGLLATFLSVSLGVAAMQAIRADRRRGVELLQSQVVDVGDFRERQLAEPFLDRVLLPMGSRFGDFAKRVTPLGMRQRIARQLVLSGNTGTMNADKMAAVKVF